MAYPGQSYTAEEVDDVIIKLERSVARHLATLESAVKRVAAERDLLSSAELARDLLLKAVAGEKDYLDKVFGGSCERIGRLRLASDQAQFSDMHASDPRWQNMKEAIETVEAVLKDLGTFKRWVPPACKAPEKLAYKGMRRRMSPGRRVNLRPDVEGGDASSFAVSPALPSGLELDATTGVISGVLQPGILLDEATYTVTVQNAAGEAHAELVFAVKDVPPAGLRYPSAVAAVTVGEAISWSPELEGGDAAEWSVSPELPPGLALDSSTGTIAGAATAVAEASSYEVVAANSGGKVSATVTLEVKEGPPSAPAYPVDPEGAVLRIGEDAELVPKAAGGSAVFSISPDLPQGLSFEEATGIIRGRPECRMEMTRYEVTATNGSGSACAELQLSVRPARPSGLRYPGLAGSYHAGQEVSLVPEVSGHVTSFSIAPPLPTGLTLDAATGAITGSFAAPAEELVYAVTASSEEGETTAELRFAVVEPPPGKFSYPAASSSVTVGEPVSLEPELAGQFLGCSFAVAPALPEGLALDAKTGAITGAPEGESEETTYSVSASNSSGSSSTDLVLQVVKPAPVDIDEDFAAKIEAIEDLADMVEEPSQVKSFGDWMIWMVHRAHLNDPTLTDFNFSNLQMPPPHIEERIAPKLAKAMATNTHIEVLTLCNSNLQKVQGVQLAESLRSNETLKELNVENNSLDSNSVRAMAVAITENARCNLETLRVLPQKQSGTFFGRPVEEAFGQMMERNQLICRLGFECDDAHWRNTIDRALLRNNDFARRRRRKGNGEEEEELAAEEKTLRRLVLQSPPATSASEVFQEDADASRKKVVRSFVAQHLKLPTTSQLQAFAKSNGTPLKYSEVAPVLKDFRTWILNAAKDTEVTVADAFEVDTTGKMKAWSESNGNWSLDIWTAGKKRYAYKANSEPALLVSEAWAAWLKTTD
eukprot:TRINITY_DN46197_c0_g1_i1.p1 TRINITY_DN46197_c0_g1~~TRINITY_DN46197_c0_g1_i1.p1  ORF type:complete len:947 (+),score=202.88 TRINITY_DN46197_c0_g1_i1:35-2842(+)